MAVQDDNSNEGREPVNGLSDILRRPGEALSLLTIFGVALYGYYRIIYDRLYSSIGGVTPEEVGLSYLAVLSRAAVAVLVAGLTVVVILGLAYRSGVDWRERGILSPILEGVVMILLLPIVALFVAAFLTSPTSMGYCCCSAPRDSGLWNRDVHRPSLNGRTVRSRS
jgi:hypothetical protein